MKCLHTHDFACIPSPSNHCKSPKMLRWSKTYEPFLYTFPSISIYIHIYIDFSWTVSWERDVPACKNGLSKLNRRNRNLKVFSTMPSLFWSFIVPRKLLFINIICWVWRLNDVFTEFTTYAFHTYSLSYNSTSSDRIFLAPK